MNANELIQKLSELTEEQKQLPIWVHNGMDPSDPDEAKWINVLPQKPQHGPYALEPARIEIST